MKKRDFVNSLFATLSLALIGCDGDGANIPDPLDDTAFATMEQNLIPGELFNFEASVIEDEEQNLDILRITGGNEAVVAPGIVYQYERTGDRTAELVLFTETEEALTRSINLTLSGEIGAALSVELRQILASSDDGTFPAEQIARIVEILNVAGGNLRVDPDDPTQLLTDVTKTYELFSNSSALEKFRGLIGGIYTLKGIARRVAFREVFLEGAESVVGVYIPFVTSVTTPIFDLESGTFSLELKNDTTLPSL